MAIEKKGFPHTDTHRAKGDVDRALRASDRAFSEVHWSRLGSTIDGSG